MLLISLFFLSSCASDTQTAIIGRWVLYERSLIVPQGQVEFLADGTALVEVASHGAMEVRWRIDEENRLIITNPSGEVMVSSILELTRTTLIIEDGGERNVFKRPQEIERLAREREREQQREQQRIRKQLRGGTDGEQRTINVSGVDIDVIFVAPGTFRMGVGAPSGRSIVQRYVTLTRGFWISRTPITQAQYQAVMGNNPSNFSGNPNNPVEQVTWYNANDFAQRVGGRLPTEAEWEFAARGGNFSQGFIFSGSNTLREVGWYSGNSNKRTQPVGQLRANELGIHDMSGNVWEWIADWWGSITTAAVTDPTGPNSGSDRVVRGGGWHGNVRISVNRVAWDSSAEDARVANRINGNPSRALDFSGFRIVFDAE